jgi:enoyl-CoA hydratase/carnithine racemase
MPRTMGHQRAFAMLVMGRKFSAAEARGRASSSGGCGHTEAEARKVAANLRVAGGAVAIAEAAEAAAGGHDTPDRPGSHLFGERMHSKEAVAAFKAFFDRKRG